MPLKGRDYELAIQNVGFEKATKDTLMQLIEINNQMIKRHSEQDILISNLLGIVDRMVRVGEFSKNKIESMERRLTKEEGHD